jgi:hypothetical protein
MSKSSKMRDVAPTSAPAPFWKDLQRRAEARTQLDTYWTRAQLRLLFSDQLTERIIWLARVRGDQERELCDEMFTDRSEKDLARIALDAILVGNRRTAKVERLVGTLTKAGVAREASA